MNSSQGAVASTTDAAVLPKEADVDQTAIATEGDRIKVFDRGVEAESDAGIEGSSAGGGGAAVKRESEDQAMEDADGASSSSVPPATVFRIRLKQPPSNIRHKMSVPELCRNFRFSIFQQIPSMFHVYCPLLCLL